MDFQICANQCVDKEVSDLDWRLPYFYNQVKGSFLGEPAKEVEIIIVENKEKMVSHVGEECVACSKGNKIFILQPHRFELNNHRRDEFYGVLYREIMNLIYSKR
jgi:hypothetical protein